MCWVWYSFVFYFLYVVLTLKKKGHKSEYLELSDLIWNWDVLFILSLQWEISAPIWKWHSFKQLYSIFHWTCSHKWKLKIIVEIRHPKNPHMCPHRALSSWWFYMHSLFVRAENYTACFHNPHLSVAFCEKVGIIALCFCTCVIPKSQKTLLEFLWKSP